MTWYEKDYIKAMMDDVMISSILKIIKGDVLVRSSNEMVDVTPQYRAPGTYHHPIYEWVRKMFYYHSKIVVDRICLRYIQFTRNN